jgi:hypothetical protein
MEDFTMDIAAMSVIMAHQQIRTDASVAIMNNVKDLVQQQGRQLIEMLEQSGSPAPHPSLGKTIDIKL